MQSNFSSLCAQARREIAVPAVPFDAVHRALERPVRARSFRTRLGAAVTASVFSAVAIAAAAEVYARTHIFLNSHTGVAPVIAVDPGTRGTFNPHATDADLRAAAKQLDFRVVLPAGLPDGTTPFQLVVIGKSAMQITYDLPGAWRRSDHLLVMLLTSDRDVVNLKGARVPAYARRGLTMQQHLRNIQFWRVGNEVVVAMADNITTQEMTRIRRAMLTR